MFFCKNIITSKYFSLTVRVQCDDAKKIWSPILFNFWGHMIRNRMWQWILPAIGKHSSYCSKLTPAKCVVKIEWGRRRAKDITRHPRVKVDSLNEHPEHRGLKVAIQVTSYMIWKELVLTWKQNISNDNMILQSLGSCLYQGIFREAKCGWKVNLY